MALSYYHIQSIRESRSMFISDEPINLQKNTVQSLSNRKYPIYLTFHPPDIHTYLTKIIYTHNKQPNVIDYYKHHLNMNLLPYLKKKYHGEKTSLLGMDAQFGQCIIKEDKQKREHKLQQSRRQLKEIQNIIDELQRINDFLEKNQNKKIEQLAEQLSSTQFLHQSKNVNKIDILQAQNHFEKLLSVIKETHHQETLQRDMEELSQAIGIFRTYLETTKNELYHKRSLIEETISFYKGYCVEGNVMYLTKKYIRGVSLRTMILNKDKRLDNQRFGINMVGNILDFTFMHGGIPNLLITTENLIVQDSGAIHLNYFSLAGIQFILFDNYVSKDQVEEILPYLSQNYLYKQQRGTKRLYSKEIIVNTIIWNFVSAFFKKDLTFSEKYINFDVQVNKTEIKSTFRKIKKDLMLKILSKEEIERFARFDEENNVKYFGLFLRIIAQQNLSSQYFNDHYAKYLQSYGPKKLKSIQEMQWAQILQHLRFHKETQHHSQISNAENKGVFRVKSYDLPKIHTYFDASILEIIDHFISILSCISDEEISVFLEKDKGLTDQQYLKTRLSKTQFSKVENCGKRLVYERQWFIKRSLYQRQFYIPIKFGLSLSSLMKYNNFPEFLLRETKPDLQNLKAVTSIMEFLLQVKEILIILQPFLTESWIKRALQEYRYTYLSRFLNDDGDKKKQLKWYTYYLHMLNYKDKMIEIQSKKQSEAGRDRRNKHYNDNSFQNSNEDCYLEQNQDEEDFLDGHTDFDLKRQFWNRFFYIFNKLFVYLKRYYLKVQEVQITPEYKINGAKFTDIIQKLEERVPPFTAKL